MDQKVRSSGESAASPKIPQRVGDCISERLCQLRPFLVSFARRLGASVDDAQDLAQQALYKALMHSDSFTGTCDNELRHWVGTILKNCYFDACRRSSKRAALAHMAAEDDFCDAKGEDLCSASDALGKLAKLPEMQRLVVCEYMLGLDYAEIAEALDLPLGTVKSRLFRAREALSA